LWQRFAFPISVLPLLCAADSAYIGAQACRSCHPSQFAGQSGSGHAQALHRAADHPLAASFTPSAPFDRPPNFHFRFARTPQGLEVRADDSKYLTRLPLEWAFGAGAHAVTFVGKATDEVYLEHSLSYYSDTRSLDITPRHEGLPAATLHQAMGQALKIEGSGPTVQDCFQCHSTGPVSVSPKQEIEITEQGVRCEVCHGPGRAHALSSGAEKPARNPGLLRAGELNRFCGTCHRFQERDARTIDWSDAWNVRHQPPYLEQSQCFQRSGGALSCLTCHGPHEKLRRDAAYYDGKCASCHNQRTRPPKEICGADCARCHMPAVAANSHLKFRNHWIGIYRNGATLKPSR
jgi:hypothetical protein